MKQMLVVLGLLACATFLGGCQGLTGREKAQYTDLKDQTVLIMVWADRPTIADFPALQLDVSSRIQQLLNPAEHDELKGVTFPNRPQTVVRYQVDHPLIYTLPITEVAPKLGSSRVIYIEIRDMRTRSRIAPDLFLGEITASVKVLAVANGKANVVFMKDDLTSRFPDDKTPDEGLPNGNDDLMYRGVVNSFSTKVVNLFVEHDED